MQITPAQPTLSFSLPSELKRIQLRSRRLVTGDLLGAYRSAFRGTGLVFTDLRAYQPGDDVKHIHWKATARTGTVFVKSYEEDRQLRVLLAVDSSASMRTLSLARDGYHRAVEFCAAVGALAQRGNDLIGLALFNDNVHTFLPPASGAKRLQSLLAALLSANASADRVTNSHTEAAERWQNSSTSTNLAQSLDYLATHQRRAGVIFVISDFVSEPFEPELRKLCINHDVVLVQMETPYEKVKDSGIVTFRDAESGTHVVIDTSSTRVKDAWNAALQEHQDSLKEISRRCGADHIVITTSATAPLIALMKERSTRQPR